MRRGLEAVSNPWPRKTKRIRGKQGDHLPSPLFFKEGKFLPLKREVRRDLLKVVVTITRLLYEREKEVMIKLCPKIL